MAKRFTLVASSKQLTKHLHSSVPPISILSSNTMCFSTACPHPQGDDPVRNDSENPVTKVEYRTKVQEEEGDSKEVREESGVTGFMADAAKQTTGKAAEVLGSVGDAAMETVDTAWDRAKRTAQNVRETTTAEADMNVVDTVEYRSAGDLKGQLGDGYDKKIEL